MHRRVFHECGLRHSVLTCPEDSATAKAAARGLTVEVVRLRHLIEFRGHRTIAGQEHHPARVHDFAMPRERSMDTKERIAAERLDI